MSDFTEREQTFKEIQKILNRLLATDEDGTNVFKKLEEYILHHQYRGIGEVKALSYILEFMNECHFSYIPIGYLNNVHKDLKDIKGNLLESSNTIMVSEEQFYKTIPKLRNSYENLQSTLSSVLIFRKTPKDQLKKIESIEKDCERVKKEAENILLAIRSAAVKSGVSQNAVHFSNAEEEHKTNANKWFRIGSITIGILAIYAILDFPNFQDGINPEFFFGSDEIKFSILLTLGFYIVIFCKKNYDAQKHNQIINSNRARTLATYQTFAEGTDSNDVKNVILAHAGASTFSNQNSGYLKKDGVPATTLPIPPTIRTLVDSVSKN